MYSEINDRPVFKYMSVNVAQIILVNGTIRWSSPTLFDDPLDVAREFDLGFPLEELEAAIIEELTYIYENQDLSHVQHNPVFRVVTELFNKHVPDNVKEEFYREIPKLLQKGSINSKKHIDELNEAWKSLIPEMRILCFSRRMNILPMWATYANNHQGAVMEFHPQRHTDSPWLLAQPVRYTDDPMAIASPKEWARSILGIEKIEYEKIFERYGCVKTTNWSFQEESRVFSFKRDHESGEHSDYEFAQDDLKAIYFGYRVKTEDIETTCTLLKYDFSHVVPYRCHIDQVSRQLKWEKITF